MRKVKVRDYYSAQNSARRKRCVYALLYKKSRKVFNDIDDDFVFIRHTPDLIYKLDSQDIEDETFSVFLNEYHVDFVY